MQYLLYVRIAIDVEQHQLMSGFRQAFEQLFHQDGCGHGGVDRRLKGQYAGKTLQLRRAAKRLEARPNLQCESVGLIARIHGERTVFVGVILGQNGIPLELGQPQQVPESRLPYCKRSQGRHPDRRRDQHKSICVLEDSTLPPANGLVLISPAIGVTPLAALAIWQARLGDLLGLPKLQWNAVLPEYDPYKYGSFAVNAGDQTYRLTLEIRSRLEALRGSAELMRFPGVLAFQSAVDATVSAPVLVKELFEGLPEAGHELVLFDINRYTDIEQILHEDPRQGIESLLGDASLPFTLSLVTNENEQSRRTVVRRKRPGDPQISETAVGVEWPDGLYSLSHVALPFPVTDPLYGGKHGIDSPGIRLGSLALRGERGVLQVSASDMLRLRWNPFYPYLERRVMEFLQPTATPE